MDACRAGRGADHVAAQKHARGGESAQSHGVRLKKQPRGRPRPHHGAAPGVEFIIDSFVPCIQ